MKLPPLKRLFDKDLMPMPQWFQPMLLLCNSFFQNVWQALNSQITFQENVRSQIIDFNYVAGSAIKLTTTLPEPLIGVILLQIGTGPIGGGVTVVWQQIEKTIEIKQITGLTNGEQYNVRLLLI